MIKIAPRKSLSRMETTPRLQAKNPFFPSLSWLMAMEVSYTSAYDSPLGLMAECLHVTLADPVAHRHSYSKGCQRETFSQITFSLYSSWVRLITTLVSVNGLSCVPSGATFAVPITLSRRNGRATSEILLHRSERLKKKFVRSWRSKTKSGQKSVLQAVSLPYLFPVLSWLVRHSNGGGG